MGARALSVGFVDDLNKDQCSEAGAKRICDRIVHYWHTKGYHGITARPVIAHVPSRLLGAYVAPVYSILTNIGPRGFPPVQPV